MQNQPSLSDFLRQRGHEITKQGTYADILAPKTSDPKLKAAFEDILFSLMQKESLRKKLRDWAYGNDGGDFRVVDSYIDFGSTFDKSFVDLKQNKDKRILKYSHSFEWYVSELLCRKYAAKVSGFGVCLSDVKNEEFDCLAIIDDGLLFIECKTGKNADLISEVGKFAKRDSELAASYSFFIFDRDYTFKKPPDDLPSIKAESALKLGLKTLEKVSVDKNTIFYYVQGHRRWFLASSGFRSFEKKLRNMLRYTSLARDGGYMQREIYSHSRINFPQ